MISGGGKIIPYLDLPLQHINDTMLRRMQRRVNRADTEKLLGTLRSRIENLVLRTTFITGFPGETEEQFAELVDFVEQQKFERLGVFTYSFEPDTPAARLPDHLPEEVKNERRDRLMAVQQEIAFAWNEAQLGRRLDVLIDRALPDQKNVWLGRSYADAPDVDGVVYVSGKKLKPGQIVPCEIVAIGGVRFSSRGGRFATLIELFGREFKLRHFLAAAYNKIDMPTTAQSPPGTKKYDERTIVNFPNQVTTVRLGLSIVLFVLLQLSLVLGRLLVVRDRRRHRLAGWVLGPALWADYDFGPDARSVCR